MVKPVRRVKIVKKRTAKFVRHHADRYARVGNSWRKPKGIDSRVRRRFRSAVPMPSIGYGSPAKTRDMLPTGFYKFAVQNVKDLALLLTQNRKFAAEIAHNVSAKKRKDIIGKAKELNIRVLNPGAKTTTEEQ